MAFMRQPASFMATAIAGTDGTILGPDTLPEDSGWQHMWRAGPADSELGNDQAEGFTDVAQTTLILAYRLIIAAQEGVIRQPQAIPDERHRGSFASHGFPGTIPECDISWYFYPTVLQEAWKPWIFVPKFELDPKILYYAIHRQEYNDGRNLDHHVVRRQPVPVRRARATLNAIRRTCTRRRAVNNR